MWQASEALANPEIVMTKVMERREMNVVEGRLMAHEFVLLALINEHYGSNAGRGKEFFDRCRYRFEAQHTELNESDVDDAQQVQAARSALDTLAAAFLS